jgi:hypothetical protein
MQLPVDLDLVRPFVERHRYNPYRHYRLFESRMRAKIVMAELERVAPDASVHVAADGHRRAAAFARRLPWESAFFGLPMARIEYIFADDAACSAPRAALEACLHALRREDVRHVSAHADIADVETAVLLEDFGFRLVGGTVTYTARPKRERLRRVRVVGSVRNFRDGDAAEVLDIAERAFRGFRGRFHLDPTLPRDRVDALYGEWAARCVARDMADTLLVSEGADGRLLGFLAFRRREPISTTSGAIIYGGGLGACRDDAPGAYPGLLHRGASLAYERGGVAEVQTQNHNAAAIATYEAVGLRLRRAQYDMSLRLG